MKTVYIDVLFFVNLIVDMMLYLSACSLRRIRPVWWRIVCAAAVGAVYSCAVFFSDLPPLAYHSLAVLLYALCAWLVLGFGNLRRYLKNIAATLFCAFLFSGIFFLLYRFFDVGSVVVFNRNVLYVDIPVFALLCIAFVCFGVIKLASVAFTRVVNTKKEYRVRVGIDGRQVDLLAGIDTGNTLCDALTGAPVVLARVSALRPLLPDGFDRFMKTLDVSALPENARHRIRLVLCDTALGRGTIPAIRPEFFQLLSPELRVEKVLIGLVADDMNGKDMLLNIDIFKEGKQDEKVA